MEGHLNYNDSLGRGGKPATTIFRPSHILLNFSFEPPRNPRPFNIYFFLNSFILENWKLLHLIIEGRGFRGGSDENMRRMWLGLEIVVAGLPFLY